MHIILTLCLVLMSAPSVFAQFSVDSSLPGSVQSGTVAPPTGWRCNAGTITATIDNGPTITFTERQNRADTTALCSNNGDNAFIIAQPWNWNAFGNADLWQATQKDFHAAAKRIRRFAPSAQLHELLHAMQTTGLALEQEAVWLV